MTSSPMISTRLSLPALAASLLLSIMGCSATKDEPTHNAKDSASRSTIDRVTAGPLARKTLRLFTEQPGRVEAFDETPILSKVSGYVEAVHFDIGDKVAKGQVLMTIYAPEYQDQLEQKLGLMGQAEAQVKQAEAALAAAHASANATQALVAQAQAAVGRAEAEVARWESENKRLQQLVSKGSVTPKLADETASQYQAAQAARQEVSAAIDSAKARQLEADANIKTADADVEAAKAKLAVARAEIKQAETMLKYTQLLSPFDGNVTSRHVDVGHYVQPAGASDSRPLMTIASVNKVRVFVNVPESEAAWVDAGFSDPNQGDKVTVLVGAATGKSIDARVTRTRLQLDPQTRSLSTEIDIDNSDLKLLPGAFVTAKILLEERTEVLTLPTTAIVKNAGETVCCAVVDGKIQHRPIQLGLRVGDDVQIVSGLDGSETIVMLRAGGLKPDQSVEVIVKPK